MSGVLKLDACANRYASVCKSLSLVDHVGAKFTTHVSVHTVESSVPHAELLG